MSSHWRQAATHTHTHTHKVQFSIEKFTIASIEKFSSFTAAFSSSSRSKDAFCISRAHLSVTRTQSLEFRLSVPARPELKENEKRKRKRKRDTRSRDTITWTLDRVSTGEEMTNHSYCRCVSRKIASFYLKKFHMKRRRTHGKWKVKSVDTEAVLSLFLSRPPKTNNKEDVQLGVLRIP